MRKTIIALLALISMVAIMLMYGYTPIMLQAETFDSYVDYTEYIVSDFDDYDTILKSSTTNLDFYYTMTFSTDFSVDYCPAGGKVADFVYATYFWSSSGGSPETAYSIGDPDLYCSQPFNTYTYSKSIPLREFSSLSETSAKNAILAINDDYIRFNTSTYVTPVAPMYGHSITFSNTKLRTFLEIRFNTTYLMSTFLSESDMQGRFPFDVTRVSRPYVLYAETDNDRYNVYNDELTTDLTARHKFAITIPEISAAIPAKLIGSGWETSWGLVTRTADASSINYNHDYYLYTFNAAPMKTPYDNVAVDTTPNYAICDTALFGWPVDCVLNGENIGSFEALGNNLLEWLIKESPLFSDIYTVAAGGFQWFGNALQFLGSFGSVGVFGGMITLSAGVLLIVWGFKGE